MSQQILFIHGGEAFPSYDAYISWLRKESIFDPTKVDRRAKRWHRNLEVFLPGWEVLRPQMPNDVNAQYMEWEIYFEKVVPFLRDGVVFIGHSLGATFLLQYLASRTLPVAVGSVHLVAPSFGIPNTSFGVQGDISRVSQYGPCSVYHSTDDMVVPYSESAAGVLRIPGAQLITYTDRGHFLSETFPELIETISNLHGK